MNVEISAQDSKINQQCIICVIVPVYKVESHLGRCIDSILAQTFSKIEIVLIDDGSPDNSPRICDEYELRDPRIHVIHQKNQGVSAARNAGLDWVMENSKSTWIAFVDSDDWLHPKFLEYLYRAATEQATQVAMCRFEKKSEYTPPRKIKQFSCKKYTISDLFLSEINNIGMGVCWNKLYSRTILEKVRFCTELLCYEDAVFLNCVLPYIKYISVISEQLYYYWVEENNSEDSQRIANQLKGLLILQQQYELFEKNKMHDMANIWRKKVLILFAEYVQKSNNVTRKQKLILHRKFKLLIKENKRFGLLDFNKDFWLYNMYCPVRAKVYSEFKHLLCCIKSSMAIFKNKT